MKNIYILLRVIRRFLPEGLTRFLLRRGIIIKPGLESANPKRAAHIYIKTFNQAGINIEGKRILIFGYGGNYGTACALLELGASHITLSDLFAPPNNPRNLELLEEYGQYLIQRDDSVSPNPKYISLVHGDIVDRAKDISVDIVLSTSVFEHLDGVGKITEALASCTTVDGSHLHFIDLRDHNFKFPFMMLTFKEKTWRKWLNPTSHLNRFRIWDYQKVFESCFKNVDIQILQRNETEFSQIQTKILPEFLCGDIAQDSVVKILALVSNPIRSE
ncbi:MAG: hypothetical protein IMY76_07865 [Chloroflexi bacterium]|nr:hypothetical protein [Chloroflexota bacterium]